MKKINKKSIRAFINNEIDKGVSKKEIFNELAKTHVDYKSRRKIMQMIRYTPDKWRTKKYGLYRTFFRAFLIVSPIIVILYIAVLTSEDITTYCVVAMGTAYLFGFENNLSSYWGFIVFGGLVFLFGVTSMLACLLAGFYFEWAWFYWSLCIIIYGIINILAGYKIPELLCPEFMRLKAPKTKPLNHRPYLNIHQKK